jgi:hypothetical protein
MERALAALFAALPAPCAIPEAFHTEHVRYDGRAPPHAVVVNGLCGRQCCITPRRHAVRSQCARAFARALTRCALHVAGIGVLGCRSFSVYVAQYNNLLWYIQCRDSWHAYSRQWAQPAQYVSFEYSSRTGHPRSAYGIDTRPVHGPVNWQFIVGRTAVPSQWPIRPCHGSSTASQLPPPTAPGGAGNQLAVYARGGVSDGRRGPGENGYR